MKNNLMSIEDFISEYEYMSNVSEEINSPDVLIELMALVRDMFLENCGEIPNFELTNGGKKIKLIL